MHANRSTPNTHDAITRTQKGTTVTNEQLRDRLMQSFTTTRDLFRDVRDVLAPATTVEPVRVETPGAGDVQGLLTFPNEGEDRHMPEDTLRSTDQATLLAAFHTLTEDWMDRDSILRFPVKRITPVAPQFDTLVSAVEKAKVFRMFRRWNAEILLHARNREMWADIDALALTADNDEVEAVLREQAKVDRDRVRHVLKTVAKHEVDPSRDWDWDWVAETHPDYQFDAELVDIDADDHRFVSQVLGDMVTKRRVKEVALPKDRYALQDRLDVFESDGAGPGDLDALVWATPTPVISTPGAIDVTLPDSALNHMDMEGRRGRISRDTREFVEQDVIQWKNVGVGKFSIREDVPPVDGEASLPGYMRIRTIKAMLDITVPEALLLRRTCMEAGMTQLLRQANLDRFRVESVTRRDDRTEVTGADLEAESLKLRTRRSRPNSLLKQQRIDNPLGVFGLCMVVAEMAAQIADDDDGKASWLEYHAPWVVDNPGAAIQEMHESLVELVGGDEWGNEVAFDATITGLLEDHGFAAPEEIVAADVEIDHDEAVLAESNDMIMNGPSDALDGYQNDFRVVNPDDPRVDDVYTWAENYEPEDRGTVMVTFRGRRMSKAAFLSLPLSMNTQDELRTLVDEVRTVRLTDLKAISFDAFGEFYDNRRLAKRNIVLRRVHTATPQERHVAEAAYAMWDKNHTVRKGGLKSVDGGVRVTWMKGGMYPDAFDSLCRAIVKNAPDNPTIIPSTNDNGNTVWTIVAGLDPEETQVRVVSDDVVTVKVAPKPVTYEIGERQVPTVGMIDTRNLR
jgi:hypothetical protein